MQRATLAGGLLLAVVARACPTLGDTGAVTFTGSVSSTCALNVTNGAGTLAPSPSFDSLSSRNAGGVPGTVDITTTGNINVSVDSASAAMQPPGDSTATTWAPAYRISGMQSVGQRSTPVLITNPGSGTITVDLTATKPSGGFVPGTYGATVTVRCGP